MQTERTLPSVIIYRYFFYRQWASFTSCVQFLCACACAKEPRYFPDRGIDRSTDCELTRAARPAPGKIARGATQLRGFDPRAPRPDPAGDGEQAAALRNISLCYSALFPCRPVSLDLFLSSSTCFFYLLHSCGTSKRLYDKSINSSAGRLYLPCLPPFTLFSILPFQEPRQYFNPRACKPWPCALCLPVTNLSPP